MKRIHKRNCAVIGIALLLVLAAVGCYVGVRAAYRRPYADTVKASGLPSSLVFAVIKAESGFREEAVSRAGAVGLMQLMPSTAEFVCRREGENFCPDRLTEGEYNVRVGCMYLAYLLERFEEDTAICAYNAGEGTVSGWLKDERYSPNGKSLTVIPYRETEGYLKKVKKFRKNYEILYDKT